MLPSMASRPPSHILSPPPASLSPANAMHAGPPSFSPRACQPAPPHAPATFSHPASFSALPRLLYHYQKPKLPGPSALCHFPAPSCLPISRSTTPALKLPRTEEPPCLLPPRP
ncbi:hypothetical protein ABPG77_010037 [Micractinium sp. CCAP 211/92]